jgi:VWFA-related protein
MSWRGISKLGVLGLLPLIAAQQGPTVFRSGTHLVEVEVVVRNQNGPVEGLTKGDFTLFDEGRPQTIAIFRAGSSGQAETVTLPAGAISNRTDSRGRALNGATVVLLDQLNTRLDLKGYERTQTVKLLRSLAASDRVALYSLGRNLRILQDFTADPQKLIDAVAREDQGLDLLPAFLGDDKGGVMMDYPDPKSIRTGDPITDRVARQSIGEMSANETAVNGGIYREITTEELSRIVRHLSGVPGRKNLVWLQEEPQVPPAVMAMLAAANVSLYPVLIRSVDPSIADIFQAQHAVELLGASTGGAGFADAGDLITAVRTAEEDSQEAYTLAFYPPEETLDGRFHRLMVQVTDKHLQIRYRPGYLAIKTALPVALPLDKDEFENPLDMTGIGLTAQIVPDSGGAGARQMRLTVDLHDLRLEHQNGRVTGAFQLWILFPSAYSLRSRSMAVDLTEEQFVQALERGYTVTVHGLDSRATGLRVVVRDVATGVIGSLRIPTAKP